MTIQKQADAIIEKYGRIIGKELKKGGFKYDWFVATRCAIMEVESLVEEAKKCDNYSRWAYWFDILNDLKSRV
jgi:hypothetical protein